MEYHTFMSSTHCPLTDPLIHMHTYNNDNTYTSTNTNLKAILYSHMEIFKDMALKLFADLTVSSLSAVT